MFRSALSSLRECITPVSNVSTFRESGEITPDEFVQAGDYLVYKFPTWSWASAPPNKCRSFLPSEKQYLVTKHVPSHCRASEYEHTDSNFEDLNEGPEGWIATSFGNKSEKDTQDMSHTVHNLTDTLPNGKNSPGKHSAPEDHIIDIEDMEEEEDDENAFVSRKESHSNNPSLRSYNLFITYSTSYRVPKLYLSGYSADGAPLSPEQMLEDIMADYRNKTATIEQAPFENGLTSVSIHPCRHASVMKSLLSRAEARRIKKFEEQSKHQMHSSKDQDDWEEVGEFDSQEVLRVDQYLVVFLKFISSVTPGIEHDNTMSVL